jgi:hypothetical protein
MLRQTRSSLFLLATEKALITVNQMVDLQDFAETATTPHHQGPSHLMAGRNSKGGEANVNDLL